MGWIVMLAESVLWPLHEFETSLQEHCFIQFDAHPWKDVVLTMIDILKFIVNPTLQKMCVHRDELYSLHTV